MSQFLSYLFFFQSKINIPVLTTFLNLTSGVQVFDRMNIFELLFICVMRVICVYVCMMCVMHVCVYDVYVYVFV